MFNPNDPRFAKSRPDGPANAPQHRNDGGSEGRPRSRSPSPYGVREGDAPYKGASQNKPAGPYPQGGAGTAYPQGGSGGGYPQGGGGGYPQGGGGGYPQGGGGGGGGGYPQVGGGGYQQGGGGGGFQQVGGSPPQVHEPQAPPRQEYQQPPQHQHHQHGAGQVAYGQPYPGQQGAAGHQPQGNPWATELFDCFQYPSGNCIAAATCPCCAYGNTQGIIWGKGCCGPCCAFYCAGSLLVTFPLTCLVTGPSRAALRQKYNLREEPYEDWVVGLLCTQCMICQEFREHKFQTGELRVQGRQPGVAAPPQKQEMY